MKKLVEKQVLRQLSESKEWLFCDYYDTIVKRDCHPEDIKVFWASALADIIDYEISASRILGVRIAAESKISKKYNGLISVSYDYRQLTDEIYARLKIVAPKALAKIGNTREEFYNKLLEIECAIEQEHQSLISERWNLICSAKKNGKKVAIVSDFYIGKDGFFKYAPKELLELIDAVYISCDYNARKETGVLYDTVLCDLEIDASVAVMLGDNPKSDKHMPEERDIKAFLVKKQMEKKVTADWQRKELRRVMEKNKKNPYSNYAFSLFYFIDGLYRYLRKNNIPKVLFCAREGEFLKELFELYEERRDVKEISTDYFFVSRLASFVPSLGGLQEEQFTNLFRQFCDISPKSFMLSIGLDNDDIEIICKAINVEAGEIIKDFANSDVFQQLRKEPCFIECYEKKVCTQKRNFAVYMERLGVQEEICIVDVGWKGTIQDNLFNAYHGEKDVTGIYLGLSETPNYSMKNRKIGINFYEFPEESTYFDIWSYDKSFYEKLLYASHASTIGYDENGNPILENFVNEKETYEFIRPIQEEIVKVFISILDIMNYGLYTAEELMECFTKIHLNTVCCIGRKHLKIQNRLVEEHFQNFGEFSWSQKKVASQIGEIFKMDVSGILKKILKDGLDIKYMYPGVKVIQKMKLTFFIPIYTRLVYWHMLRRLK